MAQRQPARAAIYHWHQSYAEHYDQDLISKPDRVAVNEKQIHLENERKVWLYAAIDIDSKVVLHVRFSQDRGTNLATTFLREIKEEHRVSVVEFLIEGMGYLTTLAKTDLLSDLNYTDRNIVGKLFQTYTMRVADSTKRETAVS